MGKATNGCYAVRPGSKLTRKQEKAVKSDLFWESLGGNLDPQRYAVAVMSVVLLAPVVFVPPFALVGAGVAPLMGFSGELGLLAGAAVGLVLCAVPFIVFGALRLPKQKRVRDLQTNGQVIFISERNLQLAVSRAQEAVARLPLSIRSDVAFEVAQHAWDLALVGARRRELQGMDVLSFGVAEAAELKQAQEQLIVAQDGLVRQLEALTKRAAKAGSLSGGDSERGVAAALSLASRLRQPSSAAVAGPLLDAYVEAYGESAK